MRLPRTGWLAAKELRELLASRAYWILLLLMGPLVGHAFITAVDSYAEASGIGGGPAALAQGLSPLDGILVPTFGAYDLAVTLLFPFVAIRIVSEEKASGAWKLMLQGPFNPGTMVAVKGLVLLAGWLLAWLPGLLALCLWKAYSGALYAPEVLNLLVGHLLRVILSSGLAVAAASVATGAASAAIVTLAFTVGAWALDFIAMGRGGVLKEVAAYTPTAALRVFEQGEFRLSTAMVSLTLGISGFAIAAVWLTYGQAARSRLLRLVLVAAVVGPMLWLGSVSRGSWDVSENRRNSFSAKEELALGRIRTPLHVKVFLAAEDPRLMDLDRNILAKLRRILPGVVIDYAVHSRAGLFETPGDHYGEVWYELEGRQAISRSTTEPIVLDTIFRLAQIQPPASVQASDFSGHPLRARPLGAAWLFYVLWPMAVCVGRWLTIRKRS